MNFKVNISKIADFDNAINEICENKGIDKPNHIEINSDDSPTLTIFVSDGWCSRLEPDAILLLNSFN